MPCSESDAYKHVCIPIQKFFLNILFKKGKNTDTKRIILRVWYLGILIIAFPRVNRYYITKRYIYIYKKQNLKHIFHFQNTDGFRTISGVYACNFLNKKENKNKL